MSTATVILKSTGQQSDFDRLIREFNRADGILPCMITPSKLTCRTEDGQLSKHRATISNVDSMSTQQKRALRRFDEHFSLTNG